MQEDKKGTSGVSCSLGVDMNEGVEEGRLRQLESSAGQPGGFWGVS